MAVPYHTISMYNPDKYWQQGGVTDHVRFCNEWQWYLSGVRRLCSLVKRESRMLGDLWESFEQIKVPIEAQTSRTVMPQVLVTLRTLHLASVLVVLRPVTFQTILQQLENKVSLVAEFADYAVIEVSQGASFDFVLFPRAVGAGATILQETPGGAAHGLRLPPCGVIALVIHIGKHVVCVATTCKSTGSCTEGMELTWVRDYLLRRVSPALHMRVTDSDYRPMDLCSIVSLVTGSV